MWLWTYITALPLQRTDPIQLIRVQGRPCPKHYTDTSQAASINSANALLPWRGQKDTMIDKFDARIHLDQIDTVPEDAREERDETWKKCVFEAYRDLVPLMVKGVDAEDRLLELEEEEKDLHSLHKPKV
jgi:arginine/serine-rich splicing factor 16